MTVIKVRIIPGSYGDYLVHPVSYHHKTKVHQYLKQVAPKGTHSSTVYFQDNLADVVELFNLTARDIKSLAWGYDVVKLVDAWVYLTCVGYDAADNVKF